MNVLLLHLDGVLPNLALMRLAAHHRAIGDRVELRMVRRVTAIQPRLGDPTWDRAYGNPQWREVHRELREGKFKVSFVQGINARMLNEETARAIGELQLRDDNMKRRRIYTAWDGKDDERRLMAGLRALVEHGGFSPDMIMVYMLIGEDAAETHGDRDYRRAKLREFGCRPYPMPFRRTKELVDFQRWVIKRHDQHTTWEQFHGKAGGEPRKLGMRRVSLPLFGGGE